MGKKLDIRCGSAFNLLTFANKQSEGEMIMRILVFGAMHMRGKSARTGEAYDMARLYVASDIRPATKDAYTRVGCGFEAAEVDCEPEVVAALVGRTFPAMLTLETENRLQGGKLVPRVTAVRDDKKAAA